MKRPHPWPARLAALLAASLCCAAAAANEPPRFALSGFGTVGVARSDKDDYRFHSSSTQDSVSPGQNFDATADTVLGLQGTGQLNDQFDLTVQAISRQAVGYNYTPHVTWAYLNYRASPALTFRVGRTTTPFFMFSDSLNVNYATPWLRPPVEVYSLNPFSDLDGIDMLYRIPVGAMDLEVQGLFGNSTLKARSASGRLSNATGIRVGLAGSGFSAQAGYTRTDLELHWDDGLYQFLNNQFGLLGQTGAQAELSGKRGHARFFSAGLQWEKNNWITVAEYARRTVDRYINSAHAWYLTVGHRFGNLTPYAMYSQQRQDTAAFAHDTAPALAPLVDFYNTTRNTAQQTTALGLRWDVARNIAIKGQVERINVAPHSRGMFTPESAAAAFKPVPPIHVLSLSVDFVF